MELTTNVSLALLRPKVVGGGSIVNQALMDRFDDVALEDFRRTSGVDFFNTDDLHAYYERAETCINIEEVPEDHRNGNAALFAEGFEANGYEYKRLRRGEQDCRFEEGNCCIECLSGCRIDSKQSSAITALPTAEEHGFELLDRTEVRTIEERSDGVAVHAQIGPVQGPKVELTFRASRVVLASGAIGNSALMLRSGFGAQLPALGTNFYCHPQYMNIGVYNHKIRAWDGPLQNYKSNDPGFRRQGFKLENVFAGPASIALLVPGYGAQHSEVMTDFENLGCIEVCVRDTNPGRISVNRHGDPVIKKKLNREDARRRAAGMTAIRNIFNATGAQRIVEGEFGIGLHLMGGLGIGIDRNRSVVNPDFRIHGSQRIYAADSSIFPNAPGINPALTISALSHKASDIIASEAR